MGGELHDGVLDVFWVEMAKDIVDPAPPDGLGWHPHSTWIATYDPATLQRLAFTPAPNSGVTPIYGYAVASDTNHTYLFGNTFEQNLSREGGFWNGPHSATKVYLARVPKGRLRDAAEYRTADGWSSDAAAAVPILQRHWAEFPFQPRFIDGQWVAVATADGYWGSGFSFDVARQPWGPWTTIEAGPVWPRDGDPKRNTYHAHLVPWRGPDGSLIVTMSNNARNMLADAWPHPERYRPMAFSVRWAVAPDSPAPSMSTNPATIPATTPATTPATGAPRPDRTTTGPPATVPATSTAAPTTPPATSPPSTPAGPTTTSTTTVTTTQTTPSAVITTTTPPIVTSINPTPGSS
jgi:hypothetical protein